MAHRFMMIQLKAGSCKFSCDGEGQQRTTRTSTTPSPLILPSDTRFACTPHRSDHRKSFAGWAMQKSTWALAFLAMIAFRRAANNQTA
jgi:hypothetical protein